MYECMYVCMYVCICFIISLSDNDDQLMNVLLWHIVMDKIS